MNKYVYQHLSKCLLISVLVVIFSSSCSGDGNSKATSVSSAKKSAPINLSLTGEELFVKNCKLCHGINGQLQLNGAKDLRESTLSLDDRAILIKEGKNAMTPFKKILSDEEIRNVAEYSMSFKTTK